MKTLSMITIGLAATALLIVGCGDAGATPSKNAKVKPTISEESLGLRKTDLYSESTTVGDATKYSKSAAGSGHTIKRAFQDAPPMIPHDVEGMLPITINNNQCTGCHMPDVAVSMGATPLPTSHFTNFRPATTVAKDGRIAKNGVATDNTSVADLAHVSIKSTGSKLSGARFNCSQCHAPQSDSPAPKNTFEAVYTSKNGASASSWSGTKLMEGIDTTK